MLRRGVSLPRFSQNMRQTPKVLEVQERARGHITMTSLVGLGFHTPPGWPKTLTFYFSLFVRHAFERQSLCARFRHEGVGVQKRF